MNEPVGIQKSVSPGLGRGKLVSKGVGLIINPVVPRVVEKGMETVKRP